MSAVAPAISGEAVCRDLADVQDRDVRAQLLGQVESKGERVVSGVAEVVRHQNVSNRRGVHDDGRAARSRPMQGGHLRAAREWNRQTPRVTLVPGVPVRRPDTRDPGQGRDDRSGYDRPREGGSAVRMASGSPRDRRMVDGGEGRAGSVARLVANNLRLVRGMFALADAFVRAAESDASSAAPAARQADLARRTVVQRWQLTSLVWRTALMS